MPTLEQATSARLAEIRDMAESGVTELTGKTRREHLSPYDVGRVVGRYGGLKPAYPELERIPDSPKAIAVAIRKGRGRAFDRVERVVREAMVREGFTPARARSRGRLSIPPHSSITRKCKRCGVDHAPSEHRFHGKGAYHRTHLFGFGENPMGKVPEVFRRYLVHLGYLPEALREDFIQALYKVHMRTPKLRRAYLAWEQNRLPSGPLFNHRRTSSRKRATKNPGRIRGHVSGRKFGKGFKWSFHGSYTSLILARRREREIPHSFIHEKGGRYYVVRPLLRKVPNPVRRKKSIKNPRGLTKVYGRVLRVEAQKTQAHRCDSKCAAANHCYYHDFKVGPSLYGDASGKRLIIE